jgi:hypothetical protein
MNHDHLNKEVENMTHLFYLHAMEYNFIVPGLTPRENRMFRSLALANARRRIQKEYDFDDEDEMD